MGSKFENKTSTLEFQIEDYMKIYLNKSIDSLVKIHSKDTIILWLKGIAFPNLKVWQFNTDEKSVIFKFERDLNPKSSWNIFYNYSYRRLITGGQTIKVSIGTKSTPIAKSDSNITLILSVSWMIWVGVFLIIVTTILFILGVKKTNLIRGSLNFAPTISVVKIKNLESTQIEVLESEIPYSLSRLQLAWWTYIVIIGFIFIWMCTDDLAFLPTSIALLLGITGGTSVVSKISEALKGNDAIKQITSVKEFEDHYKSKNVFYDIISDENGLSISRIQFAFFSVLFSLYLVWQVIYLLQFPVFSDGILMLMGISSTTYAGIKFSEK
ncbi:MAG TPA: hypothetical protein VN026_10285 [Bacteroidia bacterium]|nr:hypothetical protein [Bacteroidia bacterium]